MKGSFGAWLAGPTYWCEEAHEYHERIGPTKPCLHWLTDGALRCDRCRKQPKVTCLAWVPLYREQDGKPVLVIVHETAADLLAPLRYPDYCLVGRMEALSSVFVRLSDDALSLKSEKASRQSPVDVTNDLIGIWNMPDLNEWLRSRGSPMARAKVEPQEEPTQSNGKPFGPMYRNAAVRAEASVTDDVNSAMQRTLRRVKAKEAKEGTNGHHTAPKEGE